MQWIHEDSCGQEEIWAKLIALDAYCDSLLLDAETSVVLVFKECIISCPAVCHVVPICSLWNAVPSLMIINEYQWYIAMYIYIYIYLYIYIYRYCTFFVIVYVIIWFSWCLWDFPCHVFLKHFPIGLRSNWQPPWEEGSNEPPEVMTLERLRQEDESTVYDWVGNSGFPRGETVDRVGLVLDIGDLRWSLIPVRHISGEI